ncbi:septation protein SepH [Streptosporangium sandarakinum]|uniref:septation protein SepH n=1 Tax=Streptosporangium sandarakinum TaxID=1260955 RepID=UPI0037127592
MQELRLVAVSEDGTYLVLATAGRGTRFTLPVDDRLRAAVRGNFSRLGQYEIEVESPLRPKEIQARIRAGETAEEIAATAGIPVERVRWFEGPVLQEREYMAQQAQRCAVRLPGDSAPGPTLGELVAERLTRRGVPADEIDWDSAKRDDNLWRIKLGFVWNGHTRRAEWIFDPRRRHITPHDDEAMRLSSGDYTEPVEDATVTPFVPRVAKLAPVPPLTSEPLSQPPVSFPSVVRNDAPEPDEAEPPAARAEPVPYEQPPMPPIPAGFDPPRPTVPPLRAPDSYEPVRLPEPGSVTPVIRVRPAEPPELPKPAELTELTEPARSTELTKPAEPSEPSEAAKPAEAPEATGPGRAGTAEPAAETGAPEIFAPAPTPQSPQITAVPGSGTPGPSGAGSAGAEVAEAGEPAADGPAAAEEPKAAPAPEPAPDAGTGGSEAAPAEPTPAAPAAKEEEPRPEPVADAPIAVPAARVSLDRGSRAEPAQEEPRPAAAVKEPPAEKPADPPTPPPAPPAPPASPKPAPARPAKKARGRRASVPTWDEIMFGARRQD